MHDYTTRGGVYRPCTGLRAILEFIVLILTVILLVGCEAALDLAEVEAQSARPVQRADLFQAVASHGEAVVVVGGMGTVVKSTDSGGSWRRIHLPGKPYLVDVAVCPDGTFFAVEITDGLWSEDNDGIWTRHAIPEMTEPQALACDASSGLWVTGGFSTILHSVDAGASWESWSLDEDLYLTTVQFMDSQHGVATGEFGTVLKTVDGGQTWNRASDLPDSFYPQDTYFSNPMTGWVVGLNGTIWKTEDGGDVWQRMQNWINIPLYGISGDGDWLVAVGDNATILHHAKGDSKWVPLNGATQSRTYLRGVAGVGGGEFVVAGGGILFSVSIPLEETPAGPEGAP